MFVDDVGPATGFVGRADELEAVQRAVDAARKGRPSVVVISGEAGIGKSTLIAEAGRRAGVRILTGRCIAMGGESIPLAPLGEMLRHVRRADPELLSDPAFGPLAAWLDAREPSRDSAAALFDAVLAMLARVGDRELTIVAVEDLHWADARSWDLVDFLARNLVDEHVVVVVTFRTDEVATDPAHRRRVGELGRLPLVTRLPLSGLSAGEVAARVSAILGRPAPNELVERIATRGQGNPFFTQELVAAHQQGQTIPVVLLDLIADELSTLDERARWVLGAVSALGTDTNHELLAQVLEADVSELEETLRAALDARLLVMHADGYRFRHALISEVVYAELLPSQRARLHRRVADVLAAQPSAVLARADRAGELAFHADRGGDKARAFVALLAAADAAETVAPAAALRHLERALALWDVAGHGRPEADRAARLWQAAELASAATGNARALELARQGAAIASHPLGEAWGHERLGRYLWAAGALEASAEEFARAASLIDQGDPAVAAATSAGVAQAELMLGHYAAAAQLAERILHDLRDVVEELGPMANAFVTASRVAGIIRIHRGDPTGGVAMCRRAVRATSNAQVKALATLYLGAALVDAGFYDEAASEMLAASVEAHRTGMEASFSSYIDGVAAEALIRSGHWSRADTVLRPNDRPRTFLIGEMRLATAEALIGGRRGNPRAATELLKFVASQPVDGWHRTLVDLAACDAAAACNDWSMVGVITERVAATEMGAQILWRARTLRFATCSAVELTLDVLARQEPCTPATVVAAFRDRLEAAEQAIDPGLPVPAEISACLEEAAAHLTRLGAPDPRVWESVVAQWTEVGDPFRVAGARFHHAQAAFSTGDIASASSALQAAHQIAGELGATNLTADIEALSRRTRLSVTAPTVTVLDHSSAEQLGLTTREAEVLGLVAAGRTNRQIGESLFVSEKTASVHVSNILRKLGVTSRVDAAAIAQRLGAV